MKYFTIIHSKKQEQVLYAVTKPYKNLTKPYIKEVLKDH